MHSKTISEKRGHDFKVREEREYGIWEGLEGGNRREKCCNKIMFSKIKIILSFIYL